MFNLQNLVNGYMTAIFVFFGVICNVASVCFLKIHLNPNFKFTRKDFASQCANCNTEDGKKIAKDGDTLTEYKNGFRLIKTHSSTQNILGSANSKPRIYIYLLWITMCDTALLIFAFLMYSAPTIAGHEYSNYYIPWYPTTYTFCNTTMVASVWLMCALMYDRYRALSARLTVALSSSHKNAKKIHQILAIVSVSAFIYTLPRFFELKVVYVPHLDAVILNDTEISEGSYTTRFFAEPYQTDLVRSKFYMIGYRVIGGFLFYSLIPYILLFGASARISYILHTAAKARQRMVSLAIRNTQTSDSEKILMAVMAKFLLSRFMPTALDVVESLLGADSFNEGASYTTIFIDTSNFIIVIASTSNFLIYYLLSHAFRNTVHGRSSFRRHPTNMQCNLSLLKIPSNISQEDQ
uniref:G_PROTEIN_RECEP_F1_2 domain-containing protein n=1 Tax=Rhabditophanes sp. KR3021 TaxID=114890 RepID=A0AC35U484_9BILA